MTRDEIHNAVLNTLGQIAPEANLAKLKPTARLRAQLDMDSMDFLNFLIALNKELHVEIPERDYTRLATLDGCVNYLDALLNRPA
jgi:acyl carrier protein